MRLWHESLISYLPRQQLLGQHRECCALRGLGWGRKHATVDYVFQHPYGWLVAYHSKVMTEMVRRGYRPDLNWWYFDYRGRNLPLLDDVSANKCKMCFATAIYKGGWIYPEHDDAYLQECLENLARKGIQIKMEE